MSQSFSRADADEKWQHDKYYDMRSEKDSRQGYYDYPPEEYYTQQQAKHKPFKKKDRYEHTTPEESKDMYQDFQQWGMPGYRMQPYYE